MTNNAFLRCLGAKAVEGNHTYHNGDKRCFDVPTATNPQRASLRFARRGFGDVLADVWGLCVDIYIQPPFRSIQRRFFFAIIFHFPPVYKEGFST
jgi:hypothetical protein